MKALDKVHAKLRGKTIAEGVKKYIDIDQAKWVDLVEDLTKLSINEYPITPDDLARLITNSLLAGAVLATERLIQ